jgi:hypothetical protein
MEVYFLFQQVEISDISENVRDLLSQKLCKELYDLSDPNRLNLFFSTDTSSGFVIMRTYISFFNDTEAMEKLSTAQDIVNYGMFNQILDYFTRKTTTVLIQRPPFLHRLIIIPSSTPAPTLPMTTTGGDRTNPSTTTPPAPAPSPDNGLDSSIKIILIAVTGGAAGGFAVFIIVTLFRLSRKRSYNPLKTSSMDITSPINIGLPIQDEPVDIWVENPSSKKK